MHSSAAVLGQFFLFTCVVALASVVGILFVLFGPVPQKKKVTVVPRLAAAVPFVTPAPAPTLVQQLSRAGDEFFTPPQPVRLEMEIATAHASPPPAPMKPRGGKVQPLPKKRSARGTEAPSPFAPVVRSAQRQMREEDVATNPVELFDMDEFTAVDEPQTVPRGRRYR